MSVSEMKALTLEARSDNPDPAAAVRETMAAIMRQLASAGGGPAHLRSMIWTTSEPAAFHPARRVIDLASRESCTGFRPPVMLKQGAAGLYVEAQAVIPPPPDVQKVYREFSLGELAREYAPRLQVADATKVFDDWRRDGAAFRKHHRALDIAYGPTPGQTLDIYKPDNATKPPVVVFIHGGFWQVFDKADNAHFVDGLLRAGFAVANVDHDLCPPNTLDGIVSQIRSALQFIAREADNLGIDAGDMHVCGHSAGGHLAAIAAADPQAPKLRSVLPISGLFDLEPISLLPMGRILGLTDAPAIARQSPLKLKPRNSTRIGVTVGAKESAEFRRQSREMAEAWDGTFHLADNCNHFDILNDLKAGGVLAFALALFKRS
jgi:arylformamidase